MAGAPGAYTLTETARDACKAGTEVGRARSTVLVAIDAPGVTLRTPSKRRTPGIHWSSPADRSWVTVADDTPRSGAMTARDIEALARPTPHA